MDCSITDDIEHILKTLEQNAALFEPIRFSARINALETIEFQILDRIENVMYVQGHRTDLALLYRRAAQHWQRLTDINDALLLDLRAELYLGDDPAALFRRQISAYVGRETPVRDAVGYDDLDVFINGLFGIDTEPEETRALRPGMIGYQATPARFILELIERIPMGPDDVFVDLGSGLGRVAIMVGLLTEAEVRGIEYDPGHCAYAEHRAKQLPTPRVTFINADVREANLADGTVFFMYTPFRGELLQAVLNRLQCIARQRPLTIATYGPCTLDVAREDWLQWSGSREPDDRELAIFKRLEDRPRLT